MTTYPVYRKYKGIDVWFKIFSDSEFLEVKRVGEKLILTNVTAHVYPEFVLISDMISCADGRWDEVSGLVVEKQIKSAN